MPDIRENFSFDPATLRAIATIGKQLGQLEKALPDWLYLDTNINILVDAFGEDSKRVFDSVGVLKPSEADDGYDFYPFSTPQEPYHD